MRRHVINGGMYLLLETERIDIQQQDCMSFISPSQRAPLYRRRGSDDDKY